MLSDYDPSIWKAEAEVPGIQGQVQLLQEFKGSLDSMRLFLKTKTKTKNKNKNKKPTNQTNKKKPEKNSKHENKLNSQGTGSMVVNKALLTGNKWPY